jgi:hypothetical protein
MGWSTDCGNSHQGLLLNKFFHGMEGLEDISRLGNMGRGWSFFSTCNYEAWVLASSHLFVCSMHVLNYHLHMNGSFMVVNLMSLFSQASQSLICLPIWKWKFFCGSTCNFQHDDLCFGRTN